MYEFGEGGTQFNTNKWGVPLRLSIYFLTLQTCHRPEVWKDQARVATFKTAFLGLIAAISWVCTGSRDFSNININMPWIVLDYKKLIVGESICTCAWKAHKLIFIFFQYLFLFVDWLIGWVFMFCFSSKEVSRKVNEINSSMKVTKMWGVSTSWLVRKRKLWNKDKTQECSFIATNYQENILENKSHLHLLHSFSVK